MRAMADAPNHRWRQDGQASVSIVSGGWRHPPGPRLSNPFFEFEPNKLLRPRTPTERHRDRSAFRRGPNLDVEERAAQALAGEPIRDHAERLGIAAEFERVAVRQFTHGGTIHGERPGDLLQPH